MCREREKWKIHVKQKHYAWRYTNTRTAGKTRGKQAKRRPETSDFSAASLGREGGNTRAPGKATSEPGYLERHRPRDASPIQTPSVCLLNHGQINSRRFLCEEKSVSILIEKENCNEILF